MQMFWTHHKNRKFTTTNFGEQSNRDKRKGTATIKVDYKHQGMDRDAIQGVCEDVTGPRLMENHDSRPPGRRWHIDRQIYILYWFV